MKRKSAKSINPCDSVIYLEVHGGEFTCDTSIGKVTIFTITLPKSN